MHMRINMCMNKIINKNMQQNIKPLKLFNPRRSARRVSAEETEIAGGPPDLINPVRADYEDPQEPNKLPDLVKDTTSKKDEGEQDPASPSGQEMRITTKEWEAREAGEVGEAGEAGEAGAAGEASEVVNEGQNLVEQNQVLNEDQDFNYVGNLAGGFSVDQSLILMEQFTRLAEVVGKILTSQKNQLHPHQIHFPGRLSSRSLNNYHQLPRLSLFPQKLALELYLEPRYLRESSLSLISLKKENRDKYIESYFHFFSENDCL